MDRQSDDTFNRFEALDDLAQEEGTPVELLSMDKGQQETHVGDILNEDQILSIGDQQARQLDTDMPPIVQDTGEIGESKGLMGPVIVTPSSNRPKGTPDSTKANKASLVLGIQQKSFKKGSLDKPLKSGRKTDQEKVKIMGENLVESGSVKPIDSHFSHPHK